MSIPVSIKQDARHKTAEIIVSILGFFLIRIKPKHGTLSIEVCRASLFLSIIATVVTALFAIWASNTFFTIF